MPTDLITTLFSSVWTIFLVVLFFGGSIFVHELGHFLAARRRGVHVERFSIGFGPAIFSWRGRDGVEYRLSWFPLGGYVLLPQLADLGPIEGRTEVDVRKLPPISYSTKILVYAAGAAFNVLFAFLLASILWLAGTSVAEEEQSTKLGTVRSTVQVSPGNPVPGPAFVAGLRAMDVITAVDGRAVHSFSEIAQLIALGGGRNAAGQPEVTIAYERDGKPMPALTVQPELVGPDKIRDIGVEPAVKVTANGVQEGSAAAEAGVKPGDVLLQLNGIPVQYTSYVSDYLQENGARPVELTVSRAGKQLMLKVTPRKVVDPNTEKEVYRLGLELRGSYTFKTVHVPPWKQIGEQLTITWRNLVSLLNPHTDVGLSKMSGAIGIVRIFYDAAEDSMRAVIWFTILVNINLAIFNLLPIPVLDGGHMLFATIARLRGRALPVSLIATTQSVFMVLLLSMILYVSFFDIGRWRRDIKDRAEATQKVSAPRPAK
jgi:regulator of sigma E protease